MFTLHPQLENDTVIIADLPLCQVRLMNDANYPWLVLVPRQSGIQEVFELSEDDQLQLNLEVNAVARCLYEGSAADKINIAALGNRVSQLHIHVIARYKTDLAWPNPVWGAHDAAPYTEAEVRLMVDKWQWLLKPFIMT